MIGSYRIQDDGYFELKQGDDRLVVGGTIG